MAVAAVPSYIPESAISGASPGLRFGMYLQLWGIDRRSGEHLWSTYDFDYEIRGQAKVERQVKVENKESALSQAACLTLADRLLMQQLVERQRVQAATYRDSGSAAFFAGAAVSPFTTGLGNEHPLENGFAFLNPYGLPYMPGSGVKGVIRQAFRELSSGEWGSVSSVPEGLDWSKATEILPCGLTIEDVLFGHLEAGTDTRRWKGVLSFWDVIPLVKEDRLAVDLMTPHHKDYFQGQQSPHDSGQPVPVTFLTVPPGSKFEFNVTCNLPALRRMAPRLGDGGGWRIVLADLFDHAFHWLGFGAKTAVGYGAMERDRTAEEGVARESAERNEKVRREAEIAAMTPAMREVDAFVAAMRKKAEDLKGKKEKPNTEFHERATRLAKVALESADWTADERRLAADAIQEWLPRVVSIDMKDAARKLKLRALRGDAG